MQQQQKTCVLQGFAPLSFMARKSPLFILFFTKKESAPSLIDSIPEPQASYTPLPIPYITNTSYMGRTRCLHKQLISNEGLSTYKHVIHILNIVYKWGVSADIKMPTIRLIIPLSCIKLSWMTLLRRIYKSQTFRYFDNSWLLKLESGRFHNFDIFIFSLLGKPLCHQLKSPSPREYKD